MAKKENKRKSLIGFLLLIINVPCLLLLILAMAASFIPPYHFLPAAFCGLALLWIWLATALATVLLLFFHPKFALIGVLIVLAGIPFAMRHYAFSEKDYIPENAIRVLSFNAQGLSSQYGNGIKDKSVADSIFDFIKNTNSDIICLQEFTSVSKDLDAFMDRFSQSVNATSYHFQKYLAKATRSPGTLCLITTSKHKIIQRCAIENDYYRFGMFTDMVIHSDTVRVFNLHLQSTNIKSKDIDFVNDILHTDNRQEKSKRIYTRLGTAFIQRAKQTRIVQEEINKSPYPVIVCGDFNDTPGSFAYYNISKNLKDSFLESGSGFGQTYNGDLPLMRIDYILHDDFFRATDFHVHHNYYSDHFPVSTYLTVEPQ